MKNQLLISGGILIALLYITGCGVNNSNSATTFPVETSNSTTTATPISQASPIATEKPQISPTTPPDKLTTQKLASGTYCYTAKTEIIDADTEIIISSNNQVSGRVEATIHNEPVGYYTSYNQTLKGTLEGDKAKLNVVTKIEYDTQNTQETWTITESSLNTGRETFKRVDCGNLKNNRNDNPAIKPVRINFDRGSTSKTIKNAVVRGTRDTYLVGAKKGQQMNLKITSLENNTVFDVISPNGKTLQRSATNWSGKLPKNGDYQVVVGGTRGNASYELTVEIK